MQFKVPQNVQMEDKIVGPFTLKHMIILAAGGGFAYVIYVILARTYYWEVWFPPVFIIVLITLAFAFLRPFNVSFARFLLLIIQFNIIPKKRMWVKASAEVEMKEILVKEPTEAEKKAIQKSKDVHKTTQNLRDLSKMLDSYDKSFQSYDKTNK